MVAYFPLRAIDILIGYKTVRCTAGGGPGYFRNLIACGSRFGSRTRTFCSSCPAEADFDHHYPHTPVLLAETLHSFEGQELGSFVDGTLGAGGHAAAILAAHPELRTLLGLDVDPVAHSIARQRLERQNEALGSQCEMHFVHDNYSRIRAALSEAAGGIAVDGILLDLGVSSMQMDTAERGFSFGKDGPLDMRMGPSVVNSAEQIVNSWPEAQLAKIFKEYGEERQSRSFAARLVDARAKSPIRTTKQLAAALGAPVRQRSGRQGQRSKIHPATRVFQALRIAVNEELQHLSQAIPECIDCLLPGGRMAVITFHSLEDRIVKHAFLKATGRQPENSALGVQHELPVVGRVLTKKPLTPSISEQTDNPRCRSAKLRIFERTKK